MTEWIDGNEAVDANGMADNRSPTHAGRIERNLYAGLVSRERPESVARLLAEHSEIAADPVIARLLAARTNRSQCSSMPDGWFEPVDLRKRIHVAQALFTEEIATANDPRAHFAGREGPPPHRALHRLSRRADRQASGVLVVPPRAARSRDAPAGHGSGQPRLQQALPLAEPHEYASGDLPARAAYLAYRLIGKIGLVTDVGFEEFATDPWAMVFVAYYAARRRRRSAFTVGGQDRLFDDLSAALFERCERNGARTNWLLVARVLPDVGVLARLSEEDRGRLLGGWLIAMRDAADDLDRLAGEGGIDLKTMIVRRGNDSTSWNLTAQAWNTARTSWIALQRSLGMDAALDAFLPGKALRLMAADVAWNHAVVSCELPASMEWRGAETVADRRFATALHPDTRVFADLPRPWDVMRGRETCDRATVERACRRHGLDPVRSGWSAPIVSTKAVEYRATPELVHGVEVAPPEIATVLRQTGAYSGKPAKARTLN